MIYDGLFGPGVKVSLLTSWQVLSLDWFLSLRTLLGVCALTHYLKQQHLSSDNDLHISCMNTLPQLHSGLLACSGKRQQREAKSLNNTLPRKP